jgi:DNA-binding transcriptional LysR family regulator
MDTIKICYDSGEFQMTLHQLNIFVAVAKFKSFTQAALELRMSQPDVSVHIRHLQDEVGITLIERVGKRIALTQAGEFLQEKAAVMLSQLRETEQALAEMKGLLRGSLYLGASTTIGMYILPKPIKDFGRKYPGIKTHLRTGNSGAIERMVSAMEIDVGFTVGIPIKEVSFRTFMDDEVVLILGPNHRLAKKRDIYLSDLHDETFLLRGFSSVGWRSFERLFPNPEARANVRMELDSNQAIKWAVAEGMGISLVPKHAVLAEAKARILSVRRIQGYKFPCPLNVITHPQKKLSTAAQAFLDLFFVKKANTRKK